MKWTRNHWRDAFKRGGERAEFAVPALAGSGALPPKGGTTYLRAFTLIELLAAMALMAIVIPVAVEGLRIASRAGEVGQRKAMAARVLDRKLNEYVVMNQRQGGGQKGTAQEGNIDFDWNIRVENWREDSMRVVTCEVTYPVQGRNYSITASTLVSTQTQ